MSSRYLSILELPADCIIIAGQHAYERLNAETLAQWYPFRSLAQENERSDPAIPVALNNDAAFPPGSYAVDRSLCLVLFRKYAPGWYPTENEYTDWRIRMLEFEVIEQERYRYGREEPPEVTPVRFNTLLSNAKLGQVEDPDAQAFDGLFADPDKKKFMVRLRLPGGMSRDSAQHNLHRQGRPIVRAELAAIVAKEIEEVMGGRSLNVHERDVEFKDVILVDVHCVSVGSVQVTLATKYYSKGPLF